ncbi:hypothetical protein KIN20_007674 [Parelaphostrongylus tenuis]|uniref:Uncharacterized protein n=1 Tax=Parelaphostrongylus tenuis TaxID=148309 RepID=A0AAD5M6V6_PARTN|nr:hypothetical protein KIN20_007674 [Parelaphostrongylus tenuis]
MPRTTITSTNFLLEQIKRMDVNGNVFKQVFYFVTLSPVEKKVPSPKPPVITTISRIRKMNELDEMQNEKRKQLLEKERNTMQEH